MDRFIDRVINHNTAQTIIYPFMVVAFIAGITVAFVPTVLVMLAEELKLK